MDFKSYVAICAASCAVVSCGNDFSQPNSNDENAPVGVVVNAFATKGPLEGAQCSLKLASDDSVIAGPQDSNNGAVTFTNVVASGVVYMECSGGTYIDEATGAQVDASNLTLRVAKSIDSENGDVAMTATPLTELAVQKAIADGGLTANAESANDSVAEQFSLSADEMTSLVPTDLVTSAAQDDVAGRYGVWMATLSQRAADPDGDGVIDNPVPSATDMGAMLADDLLPALQQDGQAATILSAALRDVGSDHPQLQDSSAVTDALVQVQDLVLPKRPQDGFNAGDDVNKIFGDKEFSQTPTGQLGTGAISYSSSDEKVATVNDSGLVSIKGAGTATISASVNADELYAQGEDAFVVVVAKADQTDFNAGGDLRSVFGSENPIQAASGGQGGGAVSYESSNEKIATVADDGEVTLQATGSVVVTATKAASDNYNSATDSYTLDITVAGQSGFSVGADIAKGFGSDPFTQTASGGQSGGAVTYASSDEAVATVTSAGLVTIKAAGNVTITATKAADGNYSAISDSYALTIAQASQSGFSAGDNVSKTFGDDQFSQVATGGQSGGAVTYASSDEAVATVTSAGLVTTKAADGNYSAISDSYALTIAQASQSGFSAGDNVSKTFGDDAFTQTASGGQSGGAVTYASSDEAVATVTPAGLVTIKAVGNVTITATKAADGNYSAISDSYALTVAQASQLGFSAGDNVSKTFGDDQFSQVATGGQSDGAVTYASSDEAVAEVNSDGLVTIRSEGVVTITATKAADAGYTEISDSYELTVVAGSFSLGSVDASFAQP